MEKNESQIAKSEQQEGEKIYSGRSAENYEKHLEDGGFFENIEAFRKVVEIAKAMRAQGGEALLVGGSVRDELIGLPIKDYDLEIYKLSPEKIRDVIGSLGDVNEVGKAFGVIKLRVGNTEIDISLPRRESKTGKGHKDFSISTDPAMNIKEAARRRDFTFNALAKDIFTGKIYDYFGGVEDLQNRILRVTDEERFQDDPLRVLRAVQFVGRFGLKVDDKSAAIIRAMRSELAYLPKERLREEWLKLFLKSKKPSLGLNAAMEFGIFHELHKQEIVPLAATPQEPDWHPEGDVWIHTLMVTDEAKKIVEREGLSGDDAIIVMLAAFCHDLGKPLTTKVSEGRIRSLGHEEAGAGPATKFLSDIGVEAKLREPIIKLIKDHLKPSELYREEFYKKRSVSDGTIRRLAQRLAPATLTQLAYVGEADHLGRGQYIDINEPEKYLLAPDYPAGKWLIEKAKALKVAESKPQPLIMGRDLIALGFSPDRLFHEMIATADNLRDERGYKKEQVLSLLYDNREKKLQEILRLMQAELSGKA